MRADGTQRAQAGFDYADWELARRLANDWGGNLVTAYGAYFNPWYDLNQIWGPALQYRPKLIEQFFAHGLEGALIDDAAYQVFQNHVATHGSGYTEWSGPLTIFNSIVYEWVSRGTSWAAPLLLDFSLLEQEGARLVAAHAAYTAANEDDFFADALKLVAIGAAIYFGVTTLLPEGLAAAGAEDLALAELAGSTEGLEAVSAFEELTIAELAGEVPAGTLAEAIGEEAASAALEELTIAEGFEAAELVEAATPALETPTEVFRDPWDLLADPTIEYQLPQVLDMPLPEVSELTEIPVERLPEPPTPKPDIPINQDLLKKVFQYGSQIYKFVRSSDSSGERVLAPRPVATASSFNGEPLLLNEPRSRVPVLALVAGAAAAAVAAKRSRHRRAA